MGGDPPDPPDYTPLAEAQTAMGKEQLAMMREQFQWSKKQAGKMDKVVNRVVSGALKTERQNRQFARKQADRYENKFVPLENKMLREAQNYDTRERRNREAARDVSEVSQAAEAQRDAAERRLIGYGVDPSMLRAGSLATTGRIETAAAQAQAASGARRRVEDTGRAMRADVVNLGRGVPLMAAQGYSTALQGGQVAAGSSQGAVATGTGARTSPAVYGQGAANAYGGAVNTLNAGYQNELAAYETSQQYGLPGILSSAAGIAAGRFFEEGGPVTKEMSPSRGAIPDDVQANVNVGEVIVPEEVVRWKGEEFFEKLKQQVAKAKAGVQGGGQGVPA
jgi:hypothetical protein